MTEQSNKKLTAQDFINICYLEFVVNGKPQAYDTAMGQCMYFMVIRDHDSGAVDHGCAVGLPLQQAGCDKSFLREITQSWDMVSAYKQSLMRRYIDDVPDKFLQELQRIHDQANLDDESWRKEFADGLESMCNEWVLVYPPSAASEAGDKDDPTGD